MRFVAILAVFIHHIDNKFSSYISWGYFGVDLFFVISGFLITSILLKTDGSFKTIYLQFIARRSLRIFPLYYLVLLVLLLAGIFVVEKNAISLFTYTFNYSFPFLDLNNPIMHFWSLSTEEQFYLFWPFVVLGLKKELNVLMIVVISIICFGYLQMYYSIIPSLEAYNYTGLPARMGSLGLGGLGAILFKTRNKWIMGFLEKMWIEYVMYVVLILSLTYMNALLMGISSIYFVLKAANDSFHSNIISRILANKKIKHLGQISYGLYIYHGLVFYYMHMYVFYPLWSSLDFESWGIFGFMEHNEWIIIFPIYSLITFVIAECSYRYFEKPLLGLKDRYFKYSKTKPKDTIICPTE